MPEVDKTVQGVADAWDFYLSQHDVSVPEMIERSIQVSLTKWLDANTDLILAAIQRSARGLEDMD
jgi:hypothetical protein